MDKFVHDTVGSAKNINGRIVGTLLLNRISKELNEIHEEPLDQFDAGLIEEQDPLHWWATIKGQNGTPYEGGLFYLTIDLPLEYPFKPPKIEFATAIIHPNISQTGQIGLDVLSTKWATSMTIRTTLLSIICLLDDPNPDECLMPEFGKLYKSDRDRYNAYAVEWTRKYAAIERNNN